VAVVCLVAMASVFCRAQVSLPPSQALITSTQLVKIDASILDKHGDFVGDLGRGDFRVADGGAEQPILFFEPVQAPAQVLVMIETSPAVYLIHGQHLAAAYALLSDLNRDDQIAVVRYDEAPHEVLSFTSDKSTLLAALNTLQYSIGMGDLNFYESLSQVIDGLGAAGGKRAVVLLTTGLDSSPPGRWSALLQKLRESDIVIFPVALGGTLRGQTAQKPKRRKSEPKPTGEANAEPTAADASAEFAKADDALRTLAKMTGGRAYFPQSDLDFVTIYHEIGSAVRHEYVLGIAPAHDGKFHPLTVEVVARHGQPVKPPRARQEYRVFAREGYWAPNP
jgi:VWFA-related protein